MASQLTLFGDSTVNTKSTRRSYTREFKLPKKRRGFEGVVTFCVLGIKRIFPCSFGNKSLINPCNGNCMSLMFPILALADNRLLQLKWSKMSRQQLAKVWLLISNPPPLHTSQKSGWWGTSQLPRWTCQPSIVWPSGTKPPSPRPQLWYPHCGSGRPRKCINMNILKYRGGNVLALFPGLQSQLTQWKAL